MKKKAEKKEKDLNWMDNFKADIWRFATSSGLLLDVWRLLFTDQIFKNS